MNSWIVETKGLKKYYKLGNHVVKALDGVDFRVKEQEFVAIIGKSVNDIPAGKRGIGFVFQNYNLVPDLSVYENVVLPIELDGRRIDRRFVEDILDLLKLQEKKEALPGTLSGGQQQRAAVARAIASKPSIILADEPTGNLDTAASHDVLGLLKMAAKQFQQTIVLITHDNDIAR